MRRLPALPRPPFASRSSPWTPQTRLHLMHALMSRSRLTLLYMTRARCCSKGIPWSLRKTSSVLVVTCRDYSIPPMVKARGNLIRASSTARSTLTSTNQVTIYMDRLGSLRDRVEERRRRTWRRRSIRILLRTHQQGQPREETQQEVPLHGHPTCSPSLRPLVANANGAFSSLD